MRNCIVFLILAITTSSLFAQEDAPKSFEAYWDIAVSANLWVGSQKTVGIQTTGGVIFDRKISIGTGLGLASRNYEYITIPFEVGVMLWQGNGAMRIYGGPTYATNRETSGYLAGTELVFRPRFDMRNLKLFCAIGMAFDKSEPYRNFFEPFGPSTPVDERTVLASPRLRIGLGL